VKCSCIIGPSKALCARADCAPDLARNDYGQVEQVPGRGPREAEKEKRVATTFERVQGIVAERLGVDEDTITMDSEFIGDLNADSLDLVEVIMALEQEFGTEIKDEDAESIRTSAMPSTSSTSAANPPLCGQSADIFTSPLPTGCDAPLRQRVCYARCRIEATHPHRRRFANRLRPAVRPTSEYVSWLAPSICQK